MNHPITNSAAGFDPLENPNGETENEPDGERHSNDDLKAAAPAEVLHQVRSHEYCRAERYRAIEIKDGLKVHRWYAMMTTVVAKFAATDTATIDTTKLMVSATYRIVPPNAPVQRRRADLSSAPRAHNEMTRSRRARVAVSPSAATGCYTLGTNARYLRASAVYPWRFRRQRAAVLTGSVER